MVRSLEKLNSPACVYTLLTPRVKPLLPSEGGGREGVISGCTQVQLFLD
jgi:hypothetical protein